jgi:hypothetical protein
MVNYILRYLKIMSSASSVELLSCETLYLVWCFGVARSSMKYVSKYDILDYNILKYKDLFRLIRHSSVKYITLSIFTKSKFILRLANTGI